MSTALARPPCSARRRMEKTKSHGTRRSLRRSPPPSRDVTAVSPTQPFFPAALHRRATPFYSILLG